MRVVHVGEYVSGGVATYLRVLISEQMKNPEISKIILFMSSTNSEKLEFDSNKVEVITYSYRRGFSGIARLLSLWKIIKQMHPDVVHLHSTFAGLLRFRNLVQHASFNVIYCAHGWSFTRDSGMLKNKVYAAIERVLARGCDSIINISKSEQNAAEVFGLPVKKMITIDNSIVVPAILPKKREFDGKLRILFVGRFDRQKGVDLLVEAAKKLPQMAFKLAGRPVVGGFSIADDELPNNVELLGWLTPEEVAKEMLNSDAVIIPSRWEGFGLVALEAMSNQCAVLGANVGGLANIIDSDEIGKLFQPESVEAIVDVLSSVNRESLHAMGLAGQKRVVQRYSSVKMEQNVFHEYLSSAEH